MRHWYAQLSSKIRDKNYLHAWNRHGQAFSVKSANCNFWTHSLFIQYEQFRLNNNFRQYLKPSLMSKHVSKNFNRHPKDSPAKIIRVVSRHANPYSWRYSDKQTIWLARNLFWSATRATNTQLFTTAITRNQLLYTKTYNIASGLKFNVSNATRKHLLYKHFVAWNC